MHFEKLTTILSLNNRIMYKVSVLKIKEHRLKLRNLKFLGI